MTLTGQKVIVTNEMIYLTYLAFFGLEERQNLDGTLCNRIIPAMLKNRIINPGITKVILRTFVTKGGG